MKFQQLLCRQAVTPAKDPLLQHEWSGLVNSALRRFSGAALLRNERQHYGYPGTARYSFVFCFCGIIQYR